MPTKVKFSREDLMRGRLLEPGWYPMKVKNIKEKPSKTDQSTNWMINLENTKEGDDQGVLVMRVFNEKAMGFAKPYFEAFRIDVEADVEYDIYQTEGEMVDVFVERGKNEQTGEPTNVASQFRPIGSGAPV